MLLATVVLALVTVVASFLPARLGKTPDVIRAPLTEPRPQGGVARQLMN
ncbi:MAG TPA: hypothetical protein VGP62_22620 [Bryobacteraceae bacterium]|jgi:cation transporter-like permease|nr:hypothetical protein [Bryobacteraceae bacterium]